MQIEISDLCDHPEFFDTVAHRIWDFSWRAQGVPLATISAGLRDIVANGPFPFALVAHEGKAYIGSALGIVSDMTERPRDTPWVAAVWVEVEYRGLNVGRSLVSAATKAMHDSGFHKIFLCARPARREFYTRQGWTPIEENVGKDGLMVFCKSQ